MTQKTKNTLSPGGILLGAAIFLISCLILISLFTGTMRVRDRMAPQRYLPEKWTIEFNIINGNYYSALGNIRRLEAAGEELDAETKECAAVAHYYEAALLQKAFEKAGDPDRAGFQKKRKQEYAALAGGMSSQLEKIDELIEYY